MKLKGVEPAEFFVQIMKIAVMTVGILGLIVDSSTFEGLTTTYDEQRLAVDMLQGMAAAPCLTTGVGGEAWKGLLDEAKLDAQAGSSGFCMSIAGAHWGATIESEGRTWTFGTMPEKGTKRDAPVSVKFKDRVAPGRLTVVVRKG